jgi:hypothetical protein
MTQPSKEMTSFLRTYFNKLVADHFKDIDDSIFSNWELVKGNPRAVLKRICKHASNDTLTLSLMRVLIFAIYVQGFFDQVIAGYPESALQETNVFDNQITLFFRESYATAFDNDRQPVTKQVSIRFRDEVNTKTQLEQLANKINLIFCEPNKFYWECGEELYTYTDKKKGYYFQVYAKNETEAKKIIGACWEIQDTGLPEWDDKLVKHISTKNFKPTGTITKFGKTYKKPQKRPIAKVYFQFAQFKPTDIGRFTWLVDTTLGKKNAILYNIK